MSFFDFSLYVLAALGLITATCWFIAFIRMPKDDEGEEADTFVSELRYISHWSVYVIMVAAVAVFLVAYIFL